MEDVNLITASTESMELLKFLKTKRSNEETIDKLFTDILNIAQQLDVEQKIPRTASIQVHRTNTQSSSVLEHYRLNVHNPFLDHLISQLQDRLCNPDVTSRLLAAKLLPSQLSTMTEVNLCDIKNSYAGLIDKNDFDKEIERWKARTYDYPTPDLHQCLKITTHAYPNINIILTILLTMPVSVCSAERSFSSLKRLKTYIRSTMGAERLSSLALLHIHSQEEIDLNKVLHKFDATGHRRIALAFDTT